MPADIIELKSRRICIFDAYECKCFNSFVKAEIKNDLMKRVIVDGMTGSSWRLERFERITCIVWNINKKLLSLNMEYIDFEASVSDEGATLNFPSDDEKDDGNRYYIFRVMMKKMMTIYLSLMTAARLIIKNRASIENFSIRLETRLKLFLMMMIPSRYQRFSAWNVFDRAKEQYRL